MHHVTTRLSAGATVGAVADEVGWSSRTLHRQSMAVYGYGPATLRRILRFRRAVALLRGGAAPADVAAAAGYADQPHLHREARALAGVPVAQLASGA
jgi:AraC-like DNA-binding protein